MPDNVVPIAKELLDGLVFPEGGGLAVSDLANGDGEVHLSGTEDAKAIDAVAMQLVAQGAADVAQTLKKKYDCKKAQAQKDFAAKHKALKLPRLKATVSGETLFSTDDSYDTLGGSVAAELPSALKAHEIGVTAGEGKTFLLKLEGHELKNQFVADANQMLLHGFSGDISAGDVINVLDGISKDWTKLL